ncbi:MAG: T9SS type A sorting domain-containing protein [Fimbriimonadaceae bacterium]|nr:T9SS type A sorting domain-containing protein [Chitinophagales bacterium]
MKNYILIIACLYANIQLSAQSDNPCSATVLSVGDSCTLTSASTSGSTNTSGVPAPGCGSYTGRDVWFTLTVPASGNIIIESTSGTMTNGAMALYSGDCSSLTLIECDDNDMPGASNMPYLDVAGLTAGSTVYLRFWKFSSGFGSFNICAYAPPIGPPPANDEACSAEYITVGDTCILQAEDNLYATSSTEANPGCGSYTGSDVWYKLIIPESGEVNIETESSTMSDAAMSVYSGTCSSLSLQGCDDDSGKGTMPSISACGVPGDTLWVRIWKHGGGTGTFTLCAYIQPYENNDCIKAIQFCSTASFDDNSLDIGCVDDLNDSNHGCLTSNENQPAWYIFQFSTDGTFQFTIDPLATDDYDFAVYGPNPDCYSMIEPLKCSFALGSGDENTGINSTLNGVEYDDYEDYSGNQWVQDMDVLQDEIYIVMVDNYSTSSEGFTISFGGTATISCEPIIYLSVHITSFSGYYSEAQNILQWSVVSEDNVDHFEIQRSENTKDYIPVGYVSGTIEAGSIKDFKFNDDKPFYGNNYYRLKQVNANGEISYSKTITISNAQTSVVAIYPNPTEGIITVSYRSAEKQNLTMSLLNQFGQTILSEYIQLNAGNNNLPVLIPAKGVFQLILSTKDDTITRQILCN